MVWYKLGYCFHLSQNFNVSSDTVFQTIPINLNIIPNSDKLRIKLEVIDGTNSYSDITLEFSKQTPRQLIPSQNFEWVRHYAEVPVAINIIDSTQFRGQEYIITFMIQYPTNPKPFRFLTKR